MAREVFRKIVHTIIALVFAYSTSRFSFTAVIGVAVALLVFFVALRLFRYVTPLHDVGRFSYGEIFLPLGIFLTLLFTYGNHELFSAGMIILAFVDPAAGLVGKKFGSHQFTFFGEVRSIEGSVACLFIACMVLLFFTPSILYALFFAVILMFVEIVSLWGSDNITLPLVTVVLLHYFL